jgi:glutamine amidotransferase
MIATILDYGAGNLHSLAKALESPGISVRATDDPSRALETDVLILPGVGQFEWAASRLGGSEGILARAIRSGLPTVGICLGMQLLFERSEEGAGDGLAVLGGDVRRLTASRVPHIGWNALENVADEALCSAGLDTAYYANSFVCRPESNEDVIAWTTHESDRFPAAVRRGSVYGMQFHPEKSSIAGVAALSAVVREVAR